MSPLEQILIVLLGGLFGVFVLGMFFHKKKLAQAFEKAQKDSQKILEDAQKEADRIIKSSIQEGKEESRKRRKSFEDEAKKRKAEINKIDQRLKQRESNLQNKLSATETRERKVELFEQKLIEQEKKQLRSRAEYELMIEQNQKSLERIANMSAEEARKALMVSLEESARKKSQAVIKRIEKEAKSEAKKKAIEIVSLAVQRVSGEYVSDSTVTVVQLPSEEMKGRIIGREGRNIRAIEQAVGFDLIIDDTPEAVIVSSFNPIKREIAKITLEKLIADGRIHPARIEETVSRVEQEFAGIVKENGEQAAFDVGITDLHPQMIELLGKLKYHTVGLQSVLQHSVETSQISGLLAAELKMNIKKAKRAGLLHDIGKALDHSHEGHHAKLGADICEKYGEHADVVNAIRLYQSDDLLHAPALAVIVGAANKLSGNRPGARKELLSKYIKRLEDMEQIVLSFPDVEKAYVLQAGREVRVLVASGSMDDDGVESLSSNIVSKLTQELTFPGQVRITVLKESQHVEFAM